MFDSRSDHPFRGVHHHRAWRKEDMRKRNGRWNAGLSAKPDLTDDSLDESEPREYGPGLKMLGRIAWEHRYDNLIPDCESLDYDEPLADWELELLDGDSIATHYGDPAEQPDDEDDEQAHWLATPNSDFFDAVGEAWVIDGPSVTRPEPLREGHYVRVWELARDLNVESKHVITVLRLAGEFVDNHQSFAAVPVAEALMMAREHIVATYGERPERKFDPTATLRAMLAEEDQRAKSKRPAYTPRPGSNPFDRTYR